MDTDQVTLSRNEPLLTEAHSTFALAKGVALSCGSGRVSWRTDGVLADHGYDVADILGCSALDGPPRLVIHAAPHSSGGCCTASSPARTTSVTKLYCQSFHQASSAREAILKALGRDGRRKTWLVLINPCGGGGKAPRVWAQFRNVIEPLDLSLDVQVTTHRNHAHEIAASLTLGQYDGIMTVSGDGLIYEILNGFMTRPDGVEAARAITLFAIPGGTGNALFKNLCVRSGESADLLGAAMILAKGRSVPLDLWKYTRPTDGGDAIPFQAPGTAQADAEAGVLPAQPQGPADENRTVAWSFLSFAWGIVSDIDIESEKLRCLGSARFLLWALLRIVTLRRYTGTLRYLDAESEEWKELTSEAFIGIWAANLPYMSLTDHVAPAAGFEDGILHINVIMNATRLQVRSAAWPFRQQCLSLYLTDRVLHAATPDILGRCFKCFWPLKRVTTLESPA